MVKVLCTTYFKLVCTCYVSIVFHIDMYEGRLLMVPRQSSTNVINDALDNKNSNSCKVSFGVIEL